MIDTNSQYIMPAFYDRDFIRQSANLSYYGFEDTPEGVIIHFTPADFDKVHDAVEAYPTAYLGVMVPEMVAKASLIRDRKIGSFEFGGMTIPLDNDTRTNLTGAVVGLSRNADAASLDWSLGNGEFVSLSRDTVLALADAAFAYIQHCFTAHRTIVGEIKAAADINALEAMDIENHEAWNA